MPWPFGTWAAKVAPLTSRIENQQCPIGFWTRATGPQYNVDVFLMESTGDIPIESTGDIPILVMSFKYYKSLTGAPTGKCDSG